MFKTLQVLGPEHEFALVNQHLQPMPIVDQVIKALYGRIVNFVNLKTFTLGKELQAHVAEIKANAPFFSPSCFETTMHEAVLQITDFLERKYDTMLLGTGMHPLLQLEEAKVWAHRDRKIYDALHRLFNLRQHGWLNIQAFQLNLPYQTEKEAIDLHNQLANMLPYIPAISASSPAYESRLSEYVDNRLHFYKLNQKEAPSITGSIIPEHVSSFQEYWQRIIQRYSQELETLQAPRFLLDKEWLNSRGAILRFSRRAIEIRIMDEQESIKADVALSCFIRATLRAMLSQRHVGLPHKDLINDLNSVIRDGLDARVQHPRGPKARNVCQYYLKGAFEHASPEEKSYLHLIKRRVEDGNLSEMIRRDIVKRAQRVNLTEAIISVYLRLVAYLRKNEMYF